MKYLILSNGAQVFILSTSFKRTWTILKRNQIHYKLYSFKYQLMFVFQVPIHKFLF